MAFADNLPINESFGVFVSVAGLDWLADGYAEPAKAAILALVTGTAIFAARRWLARKNRD
jgi:hypothetical protein